MIRQKKKKEKLSVVAAVWKSVIVEGGLLRGRLVGQAEKAREGRLWTRYACYLHHIARFCNCNRNFFYRKVSVTMFKSLWETGRPLQLRARIICLNDELSMVLLSDSVRRFIYIQVCGLR